jgi:hypothetical protein
MCPPNFDGDLMDLRWYTRIFHDRWWQRVSLTRRRQFSDRRLRERGWLSEEKLAEMLKY